MRAIDQSAADKLRSLVEKATTEARLGDTVYMSREWVLLMSIAPQLALQCADMFEALAEIEVIENDPGRDYLVAHIDRDYRSDLIGNFHYIMAGV
jgi:hypothetical protein